MNTSGSSRWRRACARLGCEERSLVGQGLDDLFSPRDRKGQRRRGRAGWPKSSR